MSDNPRPERMWAVSDPADESGRMWVVVIKKEAEYWRGLNHDVFEVVERSDSGDTERHWSERISDLEEKVRELRALMSPDVWYWEVDGDNDLDSLTCPIVIHPDVLRALIAAPARSAPDSEPLHHWEPVVPGQPLLRRCAKPGSPGQPSALPEGANGERIEGWALKPHAHADGSRRITFTDKRLHPSNVPATLILRAPVPQEAKTNTLICTCWPTGEPGEIAIDEGCPVHGSAPRTGSDDNG